MCLHERQLLGSLNLTRVIGLSTASLVEDASPCLLYLSSRLVDTGLVAVRISTRVLVTGARVMGTCHVRLLLLLLYLLLLSVSVFLFLLLYCCLFVRFHISTRVVL